MSSFDCCMDTSTPRLLGLNATAELFYMHAQSMALHSQQSLCTEDDVAVPSAGERHAQRAAATAGEPSDQEASPQARASSQPPAASSSPAMSPRPEQATTPPASRAIPATNIDVRPFLRVIPDKRQKSLAHNCLKRLFGLVRSHRCALASVAFEVQVRIRCQPQSMIMDCAVNESNCPHDVFSCLSMTGVFVTMTLLSAALNFGSRCITHFSSHDSNACRGPIPFCASAWSRSPSRLGHKMCLPGRCKPLPMPSSSLEKSRLRLPSTTRCDTGFHLTTFTFLAC